MKVFCHNIYEYKKGLRHLALHTLSASLRWEAEHKLQQQDIEYFIKQVTPAKINIFFGDKDCVDVVRNIGDKSLSDYTPEEDFILGVMLGYDRLQQCKRYLQRSYKTKTKSKPIFPLTNELIRISG